MNTLITEDDSREGKNNRSPIGWKLKAHDRMRWVKVVQGKGDEQGVDGEVIWWPGMIYEDHSEMMTDIHSGKH
jgi:hypothetical protein